MKIVFVCVLILVIPLQSFGQRDKKESRQEKRIEELREIKLLIDSSVYEFTARRAYPQGGRSIDLTTNVGFLRVIHDSASANLPFFGRAYNLAYDFSGGGIKFDGSMKDYRITEDAKKGKMIIQFQVSESTDNFNCTLEVYSSSNANLSVISQNRAFISYSGSIRSID
jgi:hypothetical protein